MSKIYQAPENTRIYAIGDVHGCLKPLKGLHEEIAMDLLRHEAPEHVQIVYLGDYVDRGPDVRGVIEYLIGRKTRGDGVPKVFLEGNHERGMLDFMDDPYSPNGSSWLDWGGMETLRSYGISFEADVMLPAEKEEAALRLREALPESHWRFLNDLDLSVAIGDYFFAHAGVDPMRSFENQRAQDLMTIREPFLSWHKHEDYKPLEKKVVHGHTISPKPENFPHRIGVDTGAWSGDPLTAVVLESDQVRFLQV